MSSVLKTSLPRVVIDARMVGPHLHGIARYVSLLAQGLAAKPSLSFEPVFLIQAGMEGLFHGFEERVVRTPFLDLKEPWLLPIVIKKLKPALYHSPSFSSLAFSPCPTIVTIHDLNHLQYGGPAEKFYYQLVLKPFAKRSKKVLTVSEFSRREIEPWLNEKRGENSIQVVKNALDPNLDANGAVDEESRLKSLGLTKDRYFLSLSTEKPHKNLSTLVRAYLRWTGDDPTLATAFPLAITSDAFPSERGLVRLGRLDETDLRIVLKNARALFFPSLYEGFGLPPVEAASIGVPVVVSDIPAHREALLVSGASETQFVDPLNIDGWKNAFARAAEGRLPKPSMSYRERLKKEYSVERLTDQMISIYEECLK